MHKREDRGGNWYFVSRLGGKKVRRSLETTNQRTAAEREQAVLTSWDRHRELAEAWLDGRVSIGRLTLAAGNGTWAELHREVSRADLPGLRDAVSAFLDWKAPDVGSGTLEGYRTSLKLFSAFAGEDVAIDEALSEFTVQRFKTEQSHRVAKETVNNYLIAISNLSGYAVKRDWIQRRPEIKKFKPTPRVTLLSAKEIKKYLAALEEEYRPFMVLLLSTGMRLGEAGAVMPEWVEEAGEVGFRINLPPEVTKTQSRRVVFLPMWGKEALAGMPFGFKRGTPERRELQKAHREAVGTIGRPSYTIHDHRHTCAVMLAKQGTPLQLIQKQLGHKNITQTMQYADYHPDYSTAGGYFEGVGKELGL